MKIILSDTILNASNNRPSNFKIKQSRLSMQNNVIAKDYALLSDKKNISYKISFSLESNFSSNFHANFYALEHCSFLSSLSSFELIIEELYPPNKKKYSTTFNTALLNNFSFETNNNSVVFSYEFSSTNIIFNTENE